MKMENSTFFIVLLGCLFCNSLAKFMRVPDIGHQRFYLSYNKTVADITSSYDEMEFSQENICISKCVKDNCKALLVYPGENKSVLCKFFSEASSELVNSETNVKYFSRTTQNRCSGACVKWNKNLCNECKCLDICLDTGTPQGFHCDCTKVVPVNTSCVALGKAGFQTSGRYVIQAKGINVTVSCSFNTKPRLNRGITCARENNKCSSNSDYMRLGKVNSFGACQTLCTDKASDGTKITGVVRETRGNRRCYCLVGPIELVNRGGCEACKMRLETLISTYTGPALVLISIMSRVPSVDEAFWSKSSTEYENGFGHIGNFWFGLKNLRLLTEAFHVDMQVVMVNKQFGDRITTLYEDVSIKNKEEGFAFTYARFNNMGAREFGGYNKAKITNGSAFSFCTTNAWWEECDVSLAPTQFSSQFSFGQLFNDITSIAFYVITKGDK